jgi:prevent-host-death family protein
VSESITSTEFQNRAGRYLDAAAKAPVFITRYDRPVRVLIDIDEYERLKALDTRQAYRVEDITEDLAPALMTAEPPAWTDRYNHELEE